MNKTILIGRITANPELRTTQSGNQNTTFSLAVNRNYTKDDGTREVDYINCSAWKKQAENIAKYCTKGMLVAIEGRIQIRSYDAQDGTKRYVTEILVENCTFLSKAKEESKQPTNSEIVQAVMNDEDPFKSLGEEIELKEDDFPW